MRSSSGLNLLTEYYSDERSDHVLCATPDFSVCPSEGANYQAVGGAPPEDQRCHRAQHGRVSHITSRRTLAARRRSLARRAAAGPRLAMVLSPSTFTGGEWCARVRHEHALPAPIQEQALLPAAAQPTHPHPCSAANADNFVSTNASFPLYTRVRVACFVKAQAGDGLTPLQLFYSAAHKDHLATASAEGIAYARANNYSFLGTQGYVKAAPPPPPPSIAKYQGTALDVARAAFIVREGVDETVLATSTIFAHATRPSLLVQTLELSNTGDQPVEVRWPWNGRLFDASNERQPAA